MAWRSKPVDLDAWTADYVQRRYGAADPHALAAWNVLLHTAYDIRIDQVAFNSERDAAQESLFNAQPSLTANRASNWSPEAMRYSADAFKHALPQLLQVAPALRSSETYRYDLVDVARQTLANESRLLLPQIKDAYDAKDRARFGTLTQRWLQLMELQDRLLATNRHFLVGRWLAWVKPWATTPEEYARLDYDARSLLTTWGDRKASEGASLHDYGNKDWAGLTRDYYRLRWQVYFASLDVALRTSAPPEPIDWFAIGDAWNRSTQRYSDQAVGDAYEVATQIATRLDP
jgi:alpha-N-acetylglucosaminidase